MGGCLSLPDAEWVSKDLKDEKRYNSLIKKLDFKGRLISVDFSKSVTGSFKERLYYLSNSAVALSETIDTSLNKYTVRVKVGVYSSSICSARKLLEEII